MNKEDLLNYLKDCLERNVDAYENAEKIIYCYLSAEEMKLITTLLEEDVKND